MSFVLNSESQTFKHGFISIRRAPYIYKFTAIVKVVFHIFFVLTGSVKITGMLYKLFPLSVFSYFKPYLVYLY